MSDCWRGFSIVRIRPQTAERKQKTTKPGNLVRAMRHLVTALIILKGVFYRCGSWYRDRWAKIAKANTMFDFRNQV